MPNRIRLQRATILNSNFDDSPAISPAGTTLPRHIAGLADNLIALILAAIVAKQFDDMAVSEGILHVYQAVTAIITYFGYYLLFELILSRTPGKMLTGLKIVNFAGERCSTKQVVIRTLFRLLEVNPMILGAMPAAARIIFSEHKQRFGDHVAGTVVVFRKRKKRTN